MPTYTASVDIGGTFTDIIFQQDGQVVDYHKVPTTPRKPETGVLKGLSDNINGNNITEVIHATTIGTNALLGQAGLDLPEVCLLTTRGFEDVIEIGRQNRPSLYDLFFQRPRTLVPRDLRIGITERTTSAGKVTVPLSYGELKDVIAKLKKRGASTVAVSFLNSYLNPKNEVDSMGMLNNEFPFLSFSSQIAPEQREYERTSTTVVNAALMPIVSRYIRNLESGLKRFGNPELSIMASSGGLVSTDEVYMRPVQIVESGPAAGVIASAEISRLLGLRSIVSFDMGGTTAKAGVVVNGEVSVTSEYEVGGKSHHGRMTKGSGYPVRFPFVDLAEVSAGGGTIIWRDEAGALRIGPVSSGSDPGPICYGKGGREPTITDANLALGIIGESLLGGDMPLDLDAAVEGLAMLGDPYEVAESALNLADMEMARAIRIVTVERGLDPEDFIMIAFGGAGPQRAASIAMELGMKELIIPPRPGLFSALGLLFSDWRYESRSAFPASPEKDFDRLEREMEKDHKGASYLRYADCRYRGQGSELTVPVSNSRRENIEKSFRSLHEATFGFTLDREIEIVSVRVFAVIDRNKPALGVPKRTDCKSWMRSALSGGARTDITVYMRTGLGNGIPVNGPCAIEDYDSTTYVPDGWEASLGSIGELHLRRND